jgi:membrane protease subunit HflC
VVTTFGRAQSGPEQAGGAGGTGGAGPRHNSGSVKFEPGLYFKIPYIQQVTKYDSRARYMETPQETQQTADNSPLLVTAYMTWRVDDPLKFFKAFSASGDASKDHYEAAEKSLLIRLRSAMGEVSRYRFGELLSPDEKASKLSELEKNVKANLEQTGTRESAISDFGVKVLSVGITRIGLPQNPTRAVFERMSQERKKIADKAINQGQAEADSLRSSADSDAKKIVSFADRLARDIRKQGEIEASEWIKQMRSNPQLAVFIQQMEFMKRANGVSTTLVLPTSMPGFEVFKMDALKNLKAGQIPGPDLSALDKLAAPPAPAGAAAPTNPPVTPVTAAPAEKAGGR